MEEVFMQIDDPNIVLETLTSQTEYFKKKKKKKISRITYWSSYCFHKNHIKDLLDEDP
jgi:hypothetical protein